MLLSQIQPIEDLVSSLSHDYRMFNDHYARIVIQFETDSGSFQTILQELRPLLPAGITITWTYQAGSYEITFIEQGGIYVKYTQESIKLNDKIEEEFAPLDWADITVYEEDGTGSITFTGPCIQEGETCTSAGFRGREDAFFAKMRRIKNMIKGLGMTADLIQFYADRNCPYSEATININFEGGEL